MNYHFVSRATLAGIWGNIPAPDGNSATCLHDEISLVTGNQMDHEAGPERKFSKASSISLKGDGTNNATESDDSHGSTRSRHSPALASRFQIQLPAWLLSKPCDRTRDVSRDWFQFKN